MCIFNCLIVYTFGVVLVIYVALGSDHLDIVTWGGMHLQSFQTDEVSTVINRRHFTYFFYISEYINTNASNGTHMSRKLVSCLAVILKTD